MNCEHCGSEFESCRLTQRFCRPKCRNSSRARRHYHREYHTEWRRKNREKVNANSIKNSDANPASSILKNAKNRAATKGLAFDLEIEDIVIPELCPVFGIPMEKRTRFAPSIDRIDSSKGYVKGNILIMSRLANTMKNDATPEEQRKFAEWVLKQLKH